jgi:hippurate hydrolase
MTERCDEATARTDPAPTWPVATGASTPLVRRLAPLVERMTAWRRDLHAHPELGHQEFRTADLVAAVLAEAGIEVRRFADTGVIGTLRAGTSTTAIGLRADLDALPITEAGRSTHASLEPGVMHACGHDGHTAMLLGAAVRLAADRRFDGVVHFVFQPAEEARGGSQKMIAAGLFREFPMRSIHGLHNWPDLPLATVAVHHGAVMAACDTFRIRIRGRGGHAALPHRTVDPVLVGAHLITAVQSLVSRETDPFESVVVSVTRMETGLATNVIPEEVFLHGTIRSFDPAARRRVHDGLARIAEHGAAAFGAVAEAEIRSGIVATVNDPAEAERAAAAAAIAVGADRVRRDVSPATTGDDFGEMLAVVPGTYVWLGTGPTDPGAAPPPGLHDPAYDFADDALVFGAAYWVALVESRLAAAPLG